jgi:hypothetical protein
VLLRDRCLFAPLESWDRGRQGETTGLLERAGAAADILLWRRQVLATLEADGVLTLDAQSEDLTAAVVSEYLLIKARRLL